ncbi:MAG: phosphate ABC transporter permease PstA [Gammaproteobacteria bacterium]|nr:phosphate ABC transporter permease PstA [Gammaproteobacteria bacterium]MBU1554589.1 phosphate ABC transporter permease PstA [Gammaproteobacteria bacterium]MBU2068622.1 phosphate ABC transporter permease PstA [Gammaproteobacteria bacterium]MBU2183774.1 phosphate ABC transporter permease PstA [Gammaproteobacteria bacterium]MBU2205834.1 phosphate ABC transporter permease PstA [Gammaproteobacteria bacterium]
MTIIAENPIKAVAPPSQVQQKVIASLQKRHRKERLFRSLGLSAVLISLALVAVLFVNIFAKGMPAFWQSAITLDIYFDPKIIKVEEKPVQQAGESDNDFRQRDLAWQTQLGFINFNRLITDSLQQILPDASKHRRDLARVVTSGERFALRDMVVADPSIIGQTRTLHLLTDANIDVWLKGNIDRSLPDEQQQLSPKMREWVDKLAADGVITSRFSLALFMNPDSRSSLASAGLAGAFMGSFYMMLVVILLAVPMGVAAAIYLEEFAPRNRITDLVEVNINNLAAVPSIVFGLLGASVLIGWFNLPMSAPIVGGLVLSLMTLPTVIIATRSTLKAIPPSIRQAALGLGASKMQAIFHHVLPLAIPGILTGAILGVAQALGETAPLLLIGMKSFVASVPASPFEQATALPVQIYLWQGNELRNFFEARTSAAIIVLLMMMLSLNGLAIWLRKKYEKRW